MARTDGAPCFSKSVLCSELSPGQGQLNVEGRWSRIIRVERLMRTQGKKKIHVGWNIYTDHPDYGYDHPSKFRTAGCKITIRFWLRADTWEDRKRG